MVVQALGWLFDMYSMTTSMMMMCMYFVAVHMMYSVDNYYCLVDSCYWMIGLSLMADMDHHFLLSAFCIE